METSKISPGNLFPRYSTKGGFTPSRGKPHISPTNLTHSTPIDSPQGPVGVDLETGASSASGEIEQRFPKSMEEVCYPGRSGRNAAISCEDLFHLTAAHI